MKNQDDEITIRPVRDSDIGAITAIYADAVLTGRASFETYPPDAAEMAERLAGLRADGHPYLVAESSAGVLGYAYAGPYRTRPAYRNTVESSVYLAAEARGRGIGRRLLMAIVEAAEAAGFRQMVAIIGDAENAASIATHERCGFRHVGILTSVGRKHRTWLDTVIMQRALGAGDGRPPTRETPAPVDSA